MKALTKYKLIIISLGVFLIFSISNLFRHESVNWIENLMIAVFVGIGYKLIDYFSNSKRKRQSSQSPN